MASRAFFDCSALSPSGTISSVKASARFAPSTSEGAASRTRAIATFRADPPHSRTRVNSQTRPSETANVERSWPNAFLGQAVLPEELFERLGERVGIAELPADDDARGERFARRLEQLCRPVVRDTCRSELRRADLQADNLTLAAATRDLHLRSLL